jgi:hypothetical protein
MLKHAPVHEGRMTMAKALPQDIPTQSELAEARDFLCEAAILVTDVNLLLSDSNHLAMAPGSGRFRVASPMRFAPLSG